MMNLTDDNVRKLFIVDILFGSGYSVVRQFINDQLERSDATIELINTSEIILNEQLQNNPENNIQILLQKENHFGIPKFLKMYNNEIQHK